MSHRIRYHALVERDFDEIVHWIGDYAGEAVAGRKLDEIESAIQRLEGFPRFGSPCDDILPGLRKISAARKAVIAFTVDDEAREVLVLAVTYGGVDWSARVRARPYWKP